MFRGLGLAFSAQASVPRPVITDTNGYATYGLIAGHLESKPQRPVGVTISNGPYRYSTLTDAEGNWALVIKNRGVKVDAEAFSLENPSDRSAVVVTRSVANQQ